MELRTATAVSLLCAFAVCQQADGNVMMDANAPVLRMGSRSAGLYGINEVIVPRLDTDDDASDPQNSEINQDTETILEGTENVGDAGPRQNLSPSGDGDTTESVVDLPSNVPAGENTNDAGVTLTTARDVNGDSKVTTPNNENTGSQDLGSTSQKQDLDFHQLIIDLTKLILEQVIQNFGTLASMVPIVSKPTQSVQTIPYISDPVNAMVSNTWTNPFGLVPIRPTVTAYGTPYIYPWRKRYGPLSSLSGIPLSYPQVNGAEMVAIPPVPPNLYGALQSYPQQQLHGASLSPLGMPLGYPQVDSTVMLAIPPVSASAYDPLQSYLQEDLYQASSFGTKLDYPQMNGAGMFAIPPAELPSYGNLQDYQLDYPQMNGAGMLTTSPSALPSYGELQDYPWQQPYGPQPSPIDILLNYLEADRAIQVAIPPELRTTHSVPQTYLQEQPYTYPPSPFGMMLDYLQAGGTDTIGIPSVPPSAYGTPQTYPQQQRYGTPTSAYDVPWGYPQLGSADTVAIPPAAFAYGVPQTYSQQQQYGPIPSDFQLGYPDQGSYLPFSMM